MPKTNERDRADFTSCEAYFRYHEERLAQSEIYVDFEHIHGATNEEEERNWECLLRAARMAKKGGKVSYELLERLQERFGGAPVVHCGNCERCESRADRAYMDALMDDHPNSINMGEDFY